MFYYLIFALVYILLVPVRGDLYNTSDSVVILNGTNFYKEVLNVPNVWIIEFYNTWCGHCVHFAPKYKNFSRDIKEWDHTIKNGVLDCSDTENVPICRQYNVNAYPSIRFYGPYVSKEDSGEDIGDRKDLQKSVIQFITKKEEEAGAQIPDSWVTLSKYKGLIKDVFNYAPSSAKHAVIIVQKGDSNVAPQVIMDLGHYSMIFVRWMEAGVGEVRDLVSIPSVIIVDRSGRRENLSEVAETREELTALIMKHLQLQRRVTQAKYVTPISVKGPFESVEGAGDKSNSIEPVYRVDIENAISYALRNEVSLHSVIDGTKLESLRNFISVILRSLPLRPQIRISLESLQNFLKIRRSKIGGAEFSKQIDESFFPQQRPWVGCRGSQPHLRGYPCGLWTTFHTLTVNSYLKNRNDPSYEPIEVLEAIFGYVKFFFSCEVCSKHFQEMYNLDARIKVNRPGDEVIWLWEGHNKVNNRTKGSLSEDPFHRKHQFPSVDQCMTCHGKDAKYDRVKVLNYLNRVYGENSLSKEGLDSPSPDENSKHKRLITEEHYKNQNPIIELKRSWGFNTTDISLCVGLYMFSTVLIVSGYCLFAHKRKMRRRKYIQQLG